MGFLGPEPAYRFLRRQYPRGTGTLMPGGEILDVLSPHRSKLELFLGQDSSTQFQGSKWSISGAAMATSALRWRKGERRR